MLWVCRAGKDTCFLDMYKNTKRICVPWNGYEIDFSHITEINAIKEIVRKEKGTDNLTSITNWTV